MNALAGTGTLVRLIMRRDRILLPVWIVLSALLCMGIAVSTADVYKTAADRMTFAAGAMASPAQLFSRGTIYSASVGGLTAWTLGSSTMILGGLISILLVIRHTRVEEEAGRRELVGAAAVGRHAALTAALTVVLAANLALGLLSALALIAVGLPVGGSLVFGLSMAGGGWVLAALAGIAGQVSESAGTARALALAVMGGLYVLRGLADIGGSALSWLAWVTPIGWARLTRAYAGDEWWVLSLLGIGTAVLAVCAYALSVRRDVAGGLLPTRPGRPAASRWLTGSAALAWRLHRPQLIGWTVSFVVVGLLLGGSPRTA
ncbi:hypothetical protein [Fodinicola feengrottensis]|uniref:hypothetical protein n=1 Tax=Fodinicola feengrottensis TaxID=435914 RepID=UPI0013D042D2|nr:hypothetical protein [Fodinicola feengrottensis]